MEILIFLLIVSQSILVQTDDNVAMESKRTYQDSYKVHPDPEDEGHINDQQAQAYSVVQTFGKGVESPLKEFQDGRQNQIQGSLEKLQYSDGTGVGDGRYSHDAQNIQLVTHQQTVNYVPQDLRYKTSEDNHGNLQPVSHQVYLQFPNQQLHIFGAEASPLQQVNDNGAHNQKAIGFSSFVEHVTDKDEEEIKSALKEGSVEDIKRLIPKSGISFKIYHKGQEGNFQHHHHQHQQMEHHQTEQQSGVLSNIPTKATENVHETQKHSSQLHHRIKIEVPEAPIQEFKHTTLTATSGLSSQQKYLDNHVTDQHSEHSQKSFQTVGHLQGPQTVQTVYYTQSAQNTHKTTPQLVGVTGKVEPQFKIQVQQEQYTKPATTVNFNHNSLNVGHLVKQKNTFGQSHYQRHWNSAGGVQKSVKQVNLATKPVGNLQYQIDPVAQVVTAKGAQNVYSSTGSTHLAANSYVENKGGKGSYSNFISHPQSNLEAGKSTKIGLSGHLEGGISSQQQVSGKLYLNNEGYNTEHSQLSGTGSYVNTHTQNNIVTHSYSDSEPAKTSQHNIVSQVATSSYVDTKGSQNNFDHQKALEGSTSFDIKNAIGNTETGTHQTVGYVTPSTDIHPTVHVEKQELAYIVPKTVLIGNQGLHESSGIDAHQIKHILHQPQFAYHSVSSPVLSDVSGKFFNQGHTISGWNTEQLKQGNVLTANDLHQSVIRLQVPKEEFVQHIKTQHIDLPTSYVNHNSFSHHKQQLGGFHETRGKFPQEFHFQGKKNLQGQNIRVNHVKTSAPVAIDWSLFKSQYPNFNINTIQIKPELLTLTQDSGKKIVPILVRKRKNRSNKETAVVYGKVTNNRRPKSPTLNNENLQYNLLQQATNNVNHYSVPKGDRKNEFSVSASYKVDRSFKNSDST